MCISEEKPIFQEWQSNRKPLTREALIGLKKIPTPDREEGRIEVKVLCTDFRRDLSEATIESICGKEGSELFSSTARVKESAFRCHCSPTPAFPKLPGRLGRV